jgi:hypothetical protein
MCFFAGMHKVAYSITRFKSSVGIPSAFHLARVNALHSVSLKKKKDTVLLKIREPNYPEQNSVRVNSPYCLLTSWIYKVKDEKMKEEWEGRKDERRKE